MNSRVGSNPPPAPYTYLYVFPALSSPAPSSGPAVDCEQVSQECYFYSLEGSSYIWIQDASLEVLNGTNAILLTQLGADASASLPNSPIAEPNIFMFAAIEKTLNQNDDPVGSGGVGGTVQTYVGARDSLNRSYVYLTPDSNKTVGAILLFAKTDGNGIVLHIRASYDPEIKGST